MAYCELPEDPTQLHSSSCDAEEGNMFTGGNGFSVHKIAK